MVRTLLYPMTISAKVIRQQTQVPSLGGDAFNRDAVLEAGVHVHWALPDALTASRLLSDQGSKTLIFPGIPDLWLVVRFNPGSSSTTPLAKRTWVAWVVDSIAQISTPLAQWKPPAGRDPKQVHTFAGLLPNANTIGHAGWGLWDTAVQGRQFDPVMAAYYPESRKRFGFYDSLRDLAGRTQGNATYLVVGWFWSDQHDPLSVAETPARVLQKWQAVTSVPARALSDIGTKVDLAAPIPVPGSAPVWDVGVQVKAVDAPSAAKIDATKRALTRGGTSATRSKQLSNMISAFPPAQEAATWAQMVAPSLGVYLPKATICHGAVLGVPLAGANTAPVPIKNENVTLYPNIKRAMADIASKSGKADQVNAVEMLLADLDSQKYSTGGVLDMPGAAHAYTFQSVPGKAKVFSRIDVEAKVSVPVRAASFGLMASDMLVARNAVGYWPELTTRSASVVQKSRMASIGGLNVKQPPQPAQPQGPTDAEKQAWVASVRAAFVTATAAAAVKGVALDQRMIRVQDSRSNARSLALGPSTDGSGSDGAGWWLDIEDDVAIAQLLVTAAGARVSMPSADNVYEMPGPRWYRPWAPQVVLTNIQRSYKFGYDSRFRADGKVQTRLSGETMVSLTVSQQAAVFGQDLLINPQSFAVAGLPGEVVSLVKETLLLDPESAGAMATASGASGNAAAAAQANYANAIRGISFARDGRISDTALKALAIDGGQPSPVAISPWQDPFDPIFVDSNYSHPRSPIASWTLAGSDVEMAPDSPAATVPAAGEVETFTERSMVTATAVDVLQSALVTRTMLDPTGKPVPMQKIDKSLKADTFTKMDVISAPLTKFDSQLFARDFRVRAGALRVNSLEVVDIFGVARPWKSGVAPESPAGDPNSPQWIPLPPRLPYWSRFQFRLQSADDPDQEATPVAGPVCGMLLPDFLEHALEVFDQDGLGLGQLTTDRPVRGHSDGVTLAVKYTPHPWLPPNADPLFHVTNPILKSLVQSIAAQELVVPPGDYFWEESGLSAMLRTIDTIRGTFDPAAKTPDRKVSLIGEPIVVMGARLRFNGTGATNTADLAGDPALLSAPPEMPDLTVRLGDVTRPDDMVLGLFLAGGTPESGRFAPVTKEAANQAIVNALSTGFTGGTVAVKHPFVKDQECVVTLPANDAVDVVILADIRGGLYATCGPLPRKKITIPKDFIDAALKNLEPSFYTGPVLTTVQFESEKALLPPPDVAGYGAEFLYQKPGSAEWANSDVPAAPPLSDLPKDRVLLTEGWLRMVPQKKK